MGSNHRRLSRRFYRRSRFGEGDRSPPGKTMAIVLLVPTAVPRISHDCTPGRETETELAKFGLFVPKPTRDPDCLWGARSRRGL
jgi:hypothetical protein